MVATWLFLRILYNQLTQGKNILRYPWATAQFFTDFLQYYLNRVYTSLEWALNNPPKPHSFVSLPLQSNINGILRTFLTNLKKKCCDRSFWYKVISTGLTMLVIRELYQYLTDSKIFDTILSSIAFACTGVVIREVFSQLYDAISGSARLPLGGATGLKMNSSDNSFGGSSLGSSSQPDPRVGSSSLITEGRREGWANKLQEGSTRIIDLTDGSKRIGLVTHPPVLNDDGSVNMEKSANPVDLEKPYTQQQEEYLGSQLTRQNVILNQRRETVKNMLKAYKELSENPESTAEAIEKQRKRLQEGYEKLKYLQDSRNESFFLIYKRMGGLDLQGKTVYNNPSMMRKHGTISMTETTFKVLNEARNVPGILP